MYKQIDSLVIAVVNDGGESYVWDLRSDNVHWMQQGFGEQERPIDNPGYKPVQNAPQKILWQMAGSALVNGAQNLGPVHLVYSDAHSHNHFSMDITTGEAFVYEEYLDVDELRLVGDHAFTIHNMDSIEDIGVLEAYFLAQCRAYTLGATENKIVVDDGVVYTTWN